MTEYVVYDVFTDTPFGGNQLAVFPDATVLPQDKLQAIAAEFNFSETTFVYPAENPNHTAKVRIFTPTNELQFAGHPTIGTAIALRELGHEGPMILELGVGPIPCVFEGSTASFTTSAALERLGNPDPELVARCIGLSANAIVSATHPPTEASLGTPFILTELKNMEQLRSCQTDMSAMREGAQQSADARRFAVYCYVRENATINARMFAPLGNIPEDPATGSAAATLTAMLHETLQRDQNLQITQGVEMGRPSFIGAKSSGSPVQVTITGQAVQTMKGNFLA